MIIIVCFALAVLLDAASASAIDLEVEGRYWFTDLSAKAKVTNGSVIGTDVDFVNALGVDDKKNFWEARGAVRIGNHRIRYGFIPMEWTGSKTIDKTLTFNGKNYTGSTRVDTEIKLDYHRLGYEYDFINTLGNRLGVILEVKYFDANLRLRADSLKIDERQGATVPVPAIGVAGQLKLPLLFGLRAEATGLTLGNLGYLVDGDGGLFFKPIPFFVVEAGYRYFVLHISKTDDRGDFAVKGPYVAAKVEF